MNFDWLKSRQTKSGASMLLYIVIVVAVLVAANWLANRHNKSLDTTASKQFSLSDQTKKIVTGLKQDVIISYFDRTESFARAKDLLDRYDTLSTKLSVEYVDPWKKPQLARQFGIKSAGTVLVRAGENQQEARSVTEEEVTSALVRLLKGGVRTVCFTTGAGEPSVDESGETGFSGVRDLLDKNNYKSQSINLLEKKEVPQECTAVVVAGAKYDYPQPMVDALKTYVEKGGHALFLTAPPLQLQKTKIAENAALLKLLEGWGVTANKDIVLDTSGLGGLFGLGPEMPLVTNYETHAIVREMKGAATAFALARSLEVKSGEKTTVDKLFTSTAKSVASKSLNQPSIKLDAKNDKEGPFTLAAAGTYRTGEQGKDGRFVVVGSTDWAANYVLGFAGNRDLLLNMMNWLTNDEDLISIRPKDPEDRRIQLNRAQMNVVRTMSQFLIPLAIILAGVMVWWRRR